MVVERPSKGEILEALGRVLDSEVFSRSDRARKLLDYLVRSELDGKGDRLKGFSIAMDVFGKEGDFDPSTDAVVRVQAGRLRELLEQYYSGAGKPDAVHIAVPRGGYVPVYSRPDFTPLAVAEPVKLDMSRISAAIDARFGGDTPALATDNRPISARGDEQSGLVGTIYRHIKLFRIGLVFIIAMLGFVSWRVTTNDAGQGGGSEQTVSARGVRGAATTKMLPTVRLQISPGGEAANWGARLQAVLPAFDTVNFVNAGASSGKKEDEFLVRIAPGAAPTATLVQVEHAASGKVIAGRALDSTTSREHQDDMFANLVDSAFPVSGALYAFIAENDLTSSLTNCLTLSNRFFLDLKAEDHLAAKSCFDELAARGAKSPLVWAELANLEVASVAGKFAHHPDASLEKAAQHARKGVELGPNKATAYRAQGYVLSRMGDARAGLAWMGKAIAANPYDMSLAASAGNSFVMAGEYATGAVLLAKAARITPVHPNWWDYALFLGAFMTGDKETAWSAADALAASERRHYIAARLVAAVARGDHAQARELAVSLKSNKADFAADPQKAFREAKYPEDMARKLADAIKAALAAVGAT
ncbi:MAG: hypothetical protein IPL47_09765 [Phyllobacteriaceae bacterium]|nr:hypothetical protein [Phyllobacteriaceae bacterium]